MKRPVYLAALLALTAVLCCSPEASAATRYGTLSIKNLTHGTLNFSYKIGKNDHWHSSSIHPGQVRLWKHKYKYVNEDRSPQFYIRFDSDLTDDTFWIEYKLDRYAKPGDSVRESKQYAFEYEKLNRHYIDLKVKN
jgi:hypothetical protein